MRMRLYLDEDAMDDDLLAALRSQHIDVTTVNIDTVTLEEIENQALFLSNWG